MKQSGHLQHRILIRGAGELASATAHSLFRCGFQVLMTELPNPLAIRRTVTFSDAMFMEHATVEDVTARRCHWDDIENVLKNSTVPLFLDDPDGIEAINPDILVDARMLKKKVDPLIMDRSFVIGLGPGFTVGKNCHVVIETNRGHDLGRVIPRGSALPNTGIPGNLGGETKRRVIFAPVAGKIRWDVNIGERVKSDTRLGLMNGSVEILAPFDGLVRGLINPKIQVSKGLKIADIDPRENNVDVHRISDKARSIGRSVLEAILVEKV